MSKLTDATEKVRSARSVSARLSLGCLTWLGGAVYVANQPGMNFWDGIVWMYYVGRFIAAHATMLHAG